MKLHFKSSGRGTTSLKDENGNFASRRARLCRQSAFTLFGGCYFVLPSSAEVAILF
jgi:hypothetical protein